MTQDKGKRVISISNKKKGEDGSDPMNDRPLKRTNKGIVIQDIAKEAEVANEQPHLHQ